jgi:hypothetical protein
MTLPNTEGFGEMCNDVCFQQECTGTFMALLQIIDLTLFSNVCTYYRSHVLWADIVGCDAKQLVQWLDNLPTERFMPFASFAGKNFGKDMSAVMEPPWKRRESIPPDTTLRNWVKKLQPILSNHIHLSDTIFRYITRAHHMVLLELPEQTVDMVDKTIQEVINESKNKKWQCQGLEREQDEIPSN